MPNWTTNLKTGDSRPKLDHVRVKIKEDEETGEVFFASYNSETKSDDIIASPINGVVIGTAIMLEGFDSSLKKSYRSNYIFNTSTFTTQIYKPEGGVVFDKPVSYATAKNKMMEFVGAATKAVYVFFVFNMEDSKIYAISSNMSLSIEADKKISNAKNNGNILTITPVKYSKDSDVSKKVKEILGKLALKNAPKYVEFKIGDPIPDSVAIESGLVDAIGKFNEYSKVVVNVEEKKEVVDETPTVEEKQGLRKDKTDTKEVDLQPSSVEDDDLPF